MKECERERRKKQLKNKYLEVWLEPEGPIQFLLWRTSGCDIDREEEFLKVDEAIVVAVESPEDMRAELLGITWIIKHKLSTMPS